MATFESNPNSSGAAGWVVAIVVIVLVAGAGFYFYTRDTAPPTEIQVQTVPRNDTQDQQPAPNIFNTTVNSTTTITNSTTTDEDN